MDCGEYTALSPDDQMLAGSVDWGVEWSANEPSPKLGYTHVVQVLNFYCSGSSTLSLADIVAVESESAVEPEVDPVAVAYTDADGYEYEAEIVFPDVEASNDFSQSKPGETEITASTPIGYSIQNKTPGRDAPMPRLHLDFIWPADSVLCKSWDLLETFTLAGGDYCALGIFTGTGLSATIPSGQKHEVSAYDPATDSTEQGARYRHRWTVDEAEARDIITALQNPFATLVSGATPQVQGSDCTFFGTDGTSGSTAYYPIWSSVEIGCKTRVG